MAADQGEHGELGELPVLLPETEPEPLAALASNVITYFA